MGIRQVNRVSGITLVTLCLAALVTVLIGSAQPPQPLPHDEGALAHIFQLSVLAQFPVALLFLATADWVRPWRSLRPLAYSAVLTILAFVLLYRLEHP